MASPITITVQDFSGAVRTADPATGGVPIAASDVGEQWALFDGPTEIPVQTTVLTHRTDPWLLLDFQTSLALGEQKTYTLKPQAPVAAHATPISYTEDANTVTVITGLLKTEISKTTFNLLDAAWWNGAGIFGVTATPNLTVRENGVDYSGRGTPTAIEWEYRGPLRGVLRIDGQYLNGAANVISYTTRFTWYAGKTYVRIDHVLRNSFEAQERYVKLQDAKLSINGPISWTAIARSGGLLYADASVVSIGFNLIPPTFQVTPSLDAYHINDTINTATNSGMIIGDLSHHGATWVLEFQPSVAAGEKTRRAAVAADPLIVLAEPDRYADYNSFGAPGISTYEDEKNAYRQWGWTWPVAGNPWSVEHSLDRLDPVTEAHVGLTNMNYDQEHDNLWQSLVMFARTGVPQFLDRMRSWARNDKWERCFRTDGYYYDGSWTTDTRGRDHHFFDGPDSANRWTPVDYPTVYNVGVDDKYIDNNIKSSKPDSTFPHLIGLFDYYYMTGDRDALHAGIDMAEKCERMSYWRTMPNGAPGGNSRAEARILLGLITAWNVTGNAQWLAAAEHQFSMFVGAGESGSYDARGFHWGSAPAWLAGGKGVVPFFEADVVTAFYAYYRATGDETAHSRLLQIAQFAYQYGLDAVNGYTGGRIVMDYPTPGAVTHVSSEHYVWNGQGYPFVAGSSGEFVNTLVIYYRLTGDATYLERAKLHWERGSKRHYQDPYDQLIAGPTEVGKFVNSTEGYQPGPAYPEQGYLNPVTLLFREAVNQGSGDSSGMTFDSSEKSVYGGRPVECYKFVFGTTTYLWTSADARVVLPQGTFTPAVISRGSLDHSKEDNAGNLEVTVARDNPLVNPFMPYVPGSSVALTLFRAHRGDEANATPVFFGQVVSIVVHDSEVVLTCAPFDQAFKRQIPLLTCQPRCQWALYGAGCGLTAASFRDTCTVGSVSGVTVTSSNFSARADQWFRNGWMEDSVGDIRMVVDHVGSQIKLMSPYPALAGGHIVKVYAGCDRTEAVCASKFNNLANHLGFPRVPRRNPFVGSVA